MKRVRKIWRDFAMSGIFKRIDTVFLQVTDFEKAIDWYCTVLGFSVRWKDEKNGYAALNIGETPLTLVRGTNKTIRKENTHIPFNFYTSNIQTAYKHLVEHGVKVDEINEDNVEWFEFEDIDGNRLGVCSFLE